MPDHWLGFTASGGSVTVVGLEFDTGTKVNRDSTLPLQQGDRPSAYRVLHELVVQLVRENGIRDVAIRGSAVSKGMGLNHLEAAEVRGVVQAAASLAGARVHTLQTASITRTFGERKAAEYLTDDDFWTSSLQGQLRKGSRDAALVILAARGR